MKKTFAIACMLAIAAPVLAQSEQVNPLTGVALSYEQKQRDLETQKLQTSIMEEQLKQKEIAENIRVLPLRKKAEERQYREKREPAPKLPPLSSLVLPQRIMQPKASGLPVALAGMQIPPAPAVGGILPPAPPMPLTPQLAAIIDNGGKYEAIMQHGNNSQAVKVGDSFEGQPVKEVNANRVVIGFNTYTLGQAVPLVRKVDEQPAPGTTEPNGTGSMHPPMGNPLTSFRR